MKYNDPAFIVLLGVAFSMIGIFLGGVGAYLSTQQQTKGQIELRQKSETIATLYEKIADSQLDLRNKADIQAEAQQQLRQKSDDIAELNREIANAQIELRKKSDVIADINKDIAATVTGGDSYCFLSVHTPVQQSNIADLILYHEGKYPLYDVTISIDDVNQRMDTLHSEIKKGNLPYKSMSESFEMMEKSTKRIKIGNFGPKQAMPLGSLILPETDSRLYIITIMARNGSVHQTVQFRRVEGQWKKASKILIHDQEETEKIEPGFPRNKDGKVQW